MKSIKNNLLVASLLGCLPVIAGTEPSADSVIETPTSNATGLLVGKLVGDTEWDRAWSAFTLYKNDDNQILQEFSLKGRLQVQSIYGESGNDSFNTSDFKDNPVPNNNDSVWGNDIEARRARLAFKSKWFQNWKFEGTFNVDTDGQDNTGDNTFYRDLYDLYISYAPSDLLNVSVGKTKVRFSREQEISSNEILTIERSLVSNTLFPGELTGVWVNGKGFQDYWLYELGVYGNERVREFSSMDGGALVLGKIGYDYSSQAGLDTAVASFHYMYNSDPGYQGIFDPEYLLPRSPSFEHSIALTNDMTNGRWGLTTELMYGFGFQGTATRNGAGVAINQSDVVALSVIPSYYIADGLQLVGRLQLANSDGADGLQVPARYERLVAGDNEVGNTYASAYVGLNYYIYGHKLKLMNGIEYSHMGGGDYDGYTAMTGLRFSF